MKAVAEKTAVVTIASYPKDWRPETLGYFFESAERFGIKPIVMSEVEFENTRSGKLEHFFPWLDKMTEGFNHILYVDCRDLMFVSSLEKICEKYNKVGWPILMSAKRQCFPHVDPGWQSRFGKHSSGMNFPNAGVWMMDREYLCSTVSALIRVRDMILQDKIDSAEKSLIWSDQLIWQAAYLERMVVMRIDHDSEMVFNFHSNERYIGDFIDFEKCTDENPIVMNNGNTPCIAHFPGSSSQMMPYFSALIKNRAIGNVRKAPPFTMCASDK